MLCCKYSMQVPVQQHKKICLVMHSAFWLHQPQKPPCRNSPSLSRQRQHCRQSASCSMADCEGFSDMAEVCGIILRYEGCLCRLSLQDAPSSSSLSGSEAPAMSTLLKSMGARHCCNRFPCESRHLRAQFAKYVWHIHIFANDR